MPSKPIILKNTSPKFWRMGINIKTFRALRILNAVFMHKK